MDEQTPHIHIDFVPFIRNSKRGLDTRVSLKGALSEQGFKGGTRVTFSAVSPTFHFRIAVFPYPLSMLQSVLSENDL